MKSIETWIYHLAEKAATCKSEDAVKFAECAQRLADVHHTLMELKFQKEHMDNQGFGFELEKPEVKKN